nr:hypothetical protein GCM10020092_068540 [Actinoplanes digitatis]
MPRICFSTYPEALSHDRREERLVVLVRGQDQALDGRVDGPDVAADVDAVAVGQPGVEHGNVGTQRGDAAGRLLSRAGFADHLDVAVGLEQIEQAAADHLVVVEEKDPDHASFLLPGAGAVQGPKVPEYSAGSMYRDRRYRRAGSAG